MEYACQIEKECTCIAPDAYDWIDWMYRHQDMVIAVTCAMVLPNLLLQCCSWHYGRKLYNGLQRGMVIHARPMAQPMMHMQPQLQH